MANPSTWGDHNGPHNFDPYYISEEEERRLIDHERELKSMSIEICVICAASIDTDTDDECYAKDGRPLCMEHRAHECLYPDCGCRNDGPQSTFRCRAALG